MKKRLLAILLAACLLIGMLPMAASAAESVTANGSTITAATLHDTAGAIGDNDLCTDYGVSKTDEAGYTAITVSGTGLKRHRNGDSPEAMGYWAGVAIKPTDSAVDGMKYGVARSRENAEAAFTACTSAQALRYGMGFIQYLDLGSSSYTKQELTDGIWVKLKWCKSGSDSGSEELYNVKFAESLIPVFGTAAWDAGKTGGHGCTGMENPAIDSDTHNYTFNVTGPVEWYPASKQDPTRPTGANRVGVTITPPAGFDTSATTWSWGDYNNETWANGQDKGANTLTFYPTFTSGDLEDELTVTWKPGSTQTFKAVVSSASQLKSEWPKLTLPTDLPDGCSITVKSKHAERNEVSVTNENNFVQPGAKVTVTTAPAVGYRVKSFTVTDNNGGNVEAEAVVVNETYTFDMPTTNATVAVEFVPITYTIGKGAMEHGSVAVKVDNAEVTSAAANANVTLEATPDSGYELTTLTVTDADSGNVTVNGTGNTRTFTMPAKNVTVNATFTQTTVTPTTYTVTVDGNIQNGSVTPSKTANVAQGEEITLTVTPDGGYEIGTVSYNDGTDHTITPDGSGAYKFTMPAANVTVTATFTAGSSTPVYGTVARASGVSGGSETYTITGNGTAATNIAIAGTLEWYPAGIAPIASDGNAAAVTITPPAGFDTSASTVSLHGDTIDWDEFKTEGENTATVGYVLSSGATSDTIEITWKAGSVQTFTLDYTGITDMAPAWPTISGLGQKTEADVSASYTFSGEKHGYLVTAPAKAGLTVTLDVDPKANYALDTLTVTGADGTDIPVDSTAHTFTMPGQNVTVNATFTSTGGTTPVDPVDPDPIVPTPVVPDPTPSDEPAVETITSSDGTVTTTTTWNDGKAAVAVKTPEGDTEITVTAPDGESMAKVEIPAEPAIVKEFEDVKTGAWYETAVNSTVGYGLFNGTSETTFSPDEGMTRGMLATVLHNLSGKPAYGAGEGAFTDVKDGIWYENPVDWAYKAGVTSGTGANQFSPDNDITREQLVTMLYNYAKAIGAASKNRAGLESFPDGGKVSSYAQDAMQWAVAEGFISGRADGGENYIAPKSTATRAEVAVVLAKFVEYLK